MGTIIRLGCTLLICCMYLDAEASDSCVLQGLGQPVVVAHRGSMFEHPENTLVAFAWAQQIGADMVEFDVRSSADGHPIVIHDDDVSRTTNGIGAVQDLSLAELQSLSIGNQHSIPTLDTALAFFARKQTKLLLDLKDAQPDVAQIAGAISRHGLESDVVVGVRSVSALTELQRENADLITLAFVPEERMIDAFLTAGVDIVRLWAKSVTRKPQPAEEIRAAGACLWVTTGRLRGAALERIIKHGIDGLITDYPSEALRLRGAHSSR